MKKLRTKLTALVLAAALALLPSCSPSRADVPADWEPNGATGRYLEEYLTLPENISYILLLQQDENNDWILVANETTQSMNGSYVMWRSDDGGRSWRAEEAAWLDELNESQYLAGITYAGGGEFYLLIVQVDWELIQMFNENPDSVPDDYQEEQALYRGNSAGLTLLDFEVPQHQDYDMLPTGLDMLDNGDLLYLYYSDIYQADAQTGTVKYKYSLDSYHASAGSYTVHGDTLTFTDDGRILEYDTKTGALTGESNNMGKDDYADSANIAMHIGGYNFALDYSALEDAYYFCDGTGIYRATMEGAIVERLLDGDLSSLSMPSVFVRQLFAQPDGSFVVLGENNETPVLLRYYYDADAPSAPVTQLNVYSLEDNITIRQAMGAFQLKHPEVKVSYTVGIPEGSSITASDAMRSLSTELIAGNGPDVFVLDGMSVDSYIDKRVLIDLSPILDEKIQSGELLEAVAGTFRRDGALYAVPAKFNVPMYLGDEGSEQAAQNLTAYADWILSQQSPRLPYSSGHALLNQFYSLYQPLWFYGDGTVNEQALAETLETLDRLTMVDDIYTLEDDVDTYSSSNMFSDMMTDTIFWASGITTDSVCLLAGISDLRLPDAAMKKKGGGVFTPMQNGQSSVYVPHTILGVGADSAQTELALAFVEIVLSTEIQAVDLNGIPVNTEAIAQCMENPLAENDDGMYIGYSFSAEEDGASFEADLHIKWPDDDVMEDMVATVTNVETPSINNLVVRQMIQAEARGYFDGSRTLEDTVSSIKQKVDLYLAEQG